MAAIEEFCNSIASQKFNSFKELKEKLAAFSEKFGYKFVNSKFSYFPQSSKNRDVFVYKYLDLKCSHTNKLNCPAFCDVRCRRNSIYIRRFSMDHNHPPDPSDNSTLVDCTETFKNVFTSMVFDSIYDLETKIRELERVSPGLFLNYKTLHLTVAIKVTLEFQLTGTRFTKYSTRMLPETSEYRERLVYERVNYGCIHSGKTKPGNSAFAGVRSQRIGCEARIRACISKGKLKVMLYSMKHNHIVSNGGRYSSFANPILSSFNDPSSSLNDTYNCEGDVDVDFELNMPSLAERAANGFRNGEIPSIPIVFKKCRPSRSLNPMSRQRSRSRSTERDGLDEDEEAGGYEPYQEIDSDLCYHSTTYHNRDVPTEANQNDFLDSHIHIPSPYAYDGVKGELHPLKVEYVKEVEMSAEPVAVDVEEDEDQKSIECVTSATDDAFVDSAVKPEGFANNESDYLGQQNGS